MTTDRNRWNERYRAVDATAGSAPPSALLRMATVLPDRGLAVDLAGGTGAAARYLARRGLTAAVVDVSDVALATADRLARDEGLSLLTVRADLAGVDLGTALGQLGALDAHADADADVATEPVTLVSCFHFLQRPLLASVARDLPAGATFVAAIATVANLERNPRPPPRFLLDPGELRALVVDGPQGRNLEVLHHSEGWHDGQHHEAELAVRRL